MANHGFITTKLNLLPTEISAHLTEINNRRFKGKFSIDFNGESNTSWEIKYISTTRKGCSGFGLWIRSPKKLEFRHPYGAWMPYVLAVFTEELSKKLNGVIPNEGVEDKWKGNPETYSSYKDWIKDKFGSAHLSCSNSSLIDNIVYHTNEFFELDLKDAPEELKDC